MEHHQRSFHQVGTTAHSQFERMRMFVKLFHGVMKLKEMAYWRWMLSALLPARDKASHQGVTTLFLTETREIPLTLSLTLFWDHKFPILEHIHVQINHCQEQSILWSAWELLEIFSQVKNIVVWCWLTDSQSSCNSSVKCRFTFWVYSTNCIFTQLYTIWLSCIWIPQVGTRWEGVWMMR